MATQERQLLHELKTQQAQAKQTLETTVVIQRPRTRELRSRSGKCCRAEAVLFHKHTTVCRYCNSDRTGSAVAELTFVPPRGRSDFAVEAQVTTRHLRYLFHESAGAINVMGGCSSGTMGVRVQVLDVAN